MRVQLEPTELIGKTIESFHFTETSVVIGFGSAGYFHLEPHCDWDEHSVIVEGDELKTHQQHELGLLTPEEGEAYLKAEADKARKRLEEERLLDIQLQKDREEAKISDMFTLASLIRKHPELAKDILDGKAGFTDFTGGKVHRATPEEIATIISGDIPPERQRFPKN